MLKSVRILLTLAMSAGAAISGAHAAGGAVKEYKHNHWHFAGPFGKYDQEALQRGFLVYKTVCASCHGLDLVSFRNLGQKHAPFYLEKCPEGVPSNVDCSNPNENPVVKAIAAEYQIEDGPDDAGDMFMRAGLPSDAFPNPYTNANQARAANAGALPPDLSLITKARHHGPDYILSLLTGYEETPSTTTVAPGQYYNPYFAGDMTSNLKPEFLDESGKPIDGVKIPYGGVLAMAPPLSDGMIEYEDESVPQTVEQYSKDVVEFLMWAAEPKMVQRKALGVMTMIYMLIMCLVVYWSYREIWSNVKKND